MGLRRIGNIVLTLAVAPMVACGPAAEGPEENVSLAQQDPRRAGSVESPGKTEITDTLSEEIDEGRDITELLVCELMPGAEIAELLGGSLYAEPSPDTAGAMWNECAYLVLSSGSDTARLAAIRLYSYEHFDMARTLAEQTDETFEELPGLANEGFAVFDDPVFTVTALSDGDVTIETRVEGSVDEAREITERVLDRLDDA